MHSNRRSGSYLSFGRESRHLQRYPIRVSVLGGALPVADEAVRNLPIHASALTVAHLGLSLQAVFLNDVNESAVERETHRQRDVQRHADERGPNHQVRLTQGRALERTLLGSKHVP